MHLLVLQAYLEDKVCNAYSCKHADTAAQTCALTLQGTPMNRGNGPLWNCWAREHFQLTSKKNQIKLKGYLQLPNIQRECPKALDTDSAQLSWITEQATKDCSKWIDSILTELTGYDIICNHR